MRYIRTHWPVYGGLYGSLVLAVLLIGLSLALQWYSFITFSLAAMLIISYLLVAYLYRAYLLNDAPGGDAADILIDLAQSRAVDRVVCIDLGLRTTPVAIARYMTTGEVIAIDLYNPQSNTGAALHRARARARKPAPDPRLQWIDGSIELLPLPDRSVSAVYMNHILSEFWLPEEREQLLKEVFRILVPEGRLLLAEPIRAQSHLLLSGLITYGLPTPDHWRQTLVRAGFMLRKEKTARGLLYCARADKPSPTAGKQMQLNLEFI
ncbi:MAG: methyltransferase domain-containing protein [Candidatus Promineofilum sp.]|nr:methyltransferase domain-containing protein [Promineifilum sp.]